MATTKARVEELEATVEHLQERVDRLRDLICDAALEERLSELEKQISKFEKKMPTLPYKYGCQVREYINDKVEREVDEKSHANLIAIINFISALREMPSEKKHGR